MKIQGTPEVLPLKEDARFPRKAKCQINMRHVSHDIKPFTSVNHSQLLLKFAGGPLLLFTGLTVLVTLQVKLGNRRC